MQESVKAKTVFAMQKFELVTDPVEVAATLKRAKTEQAFVSPRFSATQRVKVTMLSQTSSGNQQDDYKVFFGMLKQPCLAAIKKSTVEFYEAWNKYL